MCLHYEDYWKLLASPFENVPDPKFYYPSPNHEEALQRLLYVVKARKGAVLLTGEIGSGKTLLSRTLIRHLPKGQYDVGLLTNPALQAQEFLLEILTQFGIDVSSSRWNPSSHSPEVTTIELPTVSKVDLLHRLNDHLIQNFKRNVDSVVIVDEAQAIQDDQIFEEIRLLLNFQMNNRQLLTLVLLGQPELHDRIRSNKQLAQRIAMHCHLSAISPDETDKYISARLKAAGASREIFSSDAKSHIHALTHGIPRKINALCDLCLLLGYMEKTEMIEASHVDRAASNLL